MPDSDFDDFLQLARYVAGTSISALSILNDGKLSLHSCIGLVMSEWDADLVSLDTEVLDAATIRIAGTDPDANFFYAGFPLQDSTGKPLGVLSVMGERPQSFSAEQTDMLLRISSKAAKLIEILDELAQVNTARHEARNDAVHYARELAYSQHLARQGSWEMDLESGQLFWSAETFLILGIKPEGFPGTLEFYLAHVHPDDRPALLLAQEQSVYHDVAMNIIFRVIRPDGRIVHVRERAPAVEQPAISGKRLSGIIEELPDSKLHEQGMLQETGRAAYEKALQAENYFRALFESSPELYIALTPDEYRIVAASDARLKATMTRREDIIGKKLFDLFSDDPNDPLATGVANLRASLERVRQYRETDVMAVQRYPIRRPEEAGGGYEERYWTPINSPVLDASGSIAFIIHRVEDVTEYVLSKNKQENSAVLSQGAGKHLDHMEADIVQRSMEIRQLANRLRESEQRFRSAFTNLLVGMVFTDLRGRFVEVNDRFSDITGFSPEELYNMRIADLTHPDDSSRNEKLLNDLLNFGTGNFQIEKRYRHKSGRIVWVHNYVSLTYNLQGQPSRISAVTIDVTQAKLAEKKIRQNEALLRIAGRLAQVGGWSISLPGQQVHCSDEIRSIYEIPRESQLTVDDMLSYCLPQWKPIVNEGLQGCISDGSSYDLEFEILTAGNKHVWVRLLGEAQRDSEGMVVQVHGALQNISGIKRAEAALREQATLLDEANDAIVVRSLEDRILYWNKAAERHYGWKAAEVVGRSVNDVLYSVSAIPFEQSLAVLMKEGDYKGRITHVRKNGTKVMVESHWILLRNEDGSPKSILAIHTDLTDRIALEEKLFQSQKLDALGKLTGGIAHDFNNLLTVIIGSAEQLTEELQDDDSLVELAEMIQSAGEKGAELTHRLLAFARNQMLEPKVVDPLDVINGMRNMLERTLGEAIHVAFIHKEKPWPVFVDRAQLESSLLNLCINSRDAMPKGGDLTIEFANVSRDSLPSKDIGEVEAGDYVMFAILDSGVGMSKEVLARACDPFFSTKSKEQGSGLGLSMVYGFVKQSRGHLRIESAPEWGTSVRIYLPRASRQQEREEDRKNFQFEVGGTEHILMVEDDDQVRELGKRLLNDMGYMVTAARNGHEALDLLRQGLPCELLFTDVVMSGGMSGPDLAAEALHLRPELPVLYASGYTQIDMDGPGASIAPLLNKPYRRNTLAAKIRAALDSRHNGS